MSEKIGHFVDTQTGEILDTEGWQIDAHGVDLIGEDGEGRWWGTQRAAWVLSEQWYVVELWGFHFAQPWQGFFIGTEEEAIEWARARRIDVLWSASGETGLRSFVKSW